MFIFNYTIIIVGSLKIKDFLTLLEMLQPVEADWNQLAYYLIKENEVDAIKAQCCQNNANDDALVETIKKWRARTSKEQRKWCTLLAVAEKWHDSTLSRFLKDSNLSGKLLIEMYKCYIRCNSTIYKIVGQ